MDQNRIGRIVSQITGNDRPERGVLDAINRLSIMESRIGNPRHQNLALVLETYAATAVSAGRATRGDCVFQVELPAEVSHPQIVRYLESRVFKAKARRFDKLLGISTKPFKLSWDKDLKDFIYV